MFFIGIVIQSINKSISQFTRLLIAHNSKFKELLKEEVIGTSFEKVDRIVDHFTLLFYAVNSSRRAKELYEFVKSLPSRLYKTECCHIRDLLNK